MTRNAFAAACAVFLAFLGTGDAAQAGPDPLTVKLSRYMSAAKEEVTVRARVERDARSRELTIEWVGEDLSGGSHVISLDGASAAATHQYALKYLSPGQYKVITTLRRMDGTEVRRTSTLSVFGSEGPEGFAAMGADGASTRRSRPAHAD